MLCERGIRTFETHTQYTLPVASVPYLHDRTHLPVVVDPEPRDGPHEPCPADRRRGRGRRRRRTMLEVHPDPRNGLSDGYQSLTFHAQFEETMALIRRVAEAVGKQV